MIAHFPRLREGAVTGLVPKFGGLPWGLPARLWPTCADCGRPMSHLAQLPDAPPALPVGEGLVLFLFKCESDNVCSFWEHAGGANAAFPVPIDALAHQPTPMPTHPEGDSLVMREIGISGWDTHDDGVPPEHEDAYYDYDAFWALPSDLQFPDTREGAWQTKSGGAPFWSGASGAQCEDGFPPGRLLLQIDNWLRLEDGKHASIANFCSDGTAYVFVDRTSQTPRFSMFINR